MTSDLSVTEHWTITGQRVVLTGSGPVIRSIALQVGLPLDSQARLSRDRAAIALWGEPLTRYLHQHGKTGSGREIAAQADVVISAGVA